MSFFTIVSLRMPSASALKFVTMRCRSTGSAHLADVLRAHVVPALQQRPGLARKHEVLAGPRPPQPTKSLTKSGTPPSLTRVIRDSCRA